MVLLGIWTSGRRAAGYPGLVSAPRFHTSICRPDRVQPGAFSREWVERSSYGIYTSRRAAALGQMQAVYVDRATGGPRTMTHGERRGLVLGTSRRRLLRQRGWFTVQPAGRSVGAGDPGAMGWKREGRYLVRQTWVSGFASGLAPRAGSVLPPRAQIASWAGGVAERRTGVGCAGCPSGEGAADQRKYPSPSDPGSLFQRTYTPNDAFSCAITWRDSASRRCGVALVGRGEAPRSLRPRSAARRRFQGGGVGRRVPSAQGIGAGFRPPRAGVEWGYGAMGGAVEGRAPQGCSGTRGPQKRRWNRTDGADGP